MTGKYLVMAAALMLSGSGAFAAIVVDGALDAGYGAAIGTDAVIPASGEGGAGTNAAVDLFDLYATVDSGNLYILQRVAVDVTATNWGKYVIYIDTGAAISGASNADAWGRAITATSDYQFHCWVDSGGGSSFNKWNQGTTTWDADAAGSTFAFVGGASPSGIEISIPLANLNNPLSVNIASVSTGGGGTDNGQDAIPTSNPNAADWSTVTNIANFITFSTVSGVADWTMMDE